MEVFLIVLLNMFIGTVIGRILFRKRLGINSRYYIGKQLSQYDRETGPLRAIDSDDLSSARTYGLWSIPFWFLTLAMFIIQAPTPAEKQREQEIRLQQLLDRADNMIERLES